MCHIHGDSYHSPNKRRCVSSVAQPSPRNSWTKTMSEEDYRLLVKNSLDSLKELVSTGFVSITNSQGEYKLFSKEQIDHVYEVIKIISKKLDDSILSATHNIEILRDDIKLTAKALADSVNKQTEHVNERFGRIESMHAKLWGGIGALGFLFPICVGIAIYILEHK